VKRCPTCGLDYADEQKFCPKDGTALRSSAQGTLVDSIVADRYHIVKKLGEGGMGAVYLGEHVKMGRKSAIKVMAGSMASDPDAIARFNREAANAARINHPNVCAIYDFGETPDGIIYLAMEFIEGESLGAVLDREGILPPARAVDIVRQTAEALQAAHDLGIVHRDLKPDNIMLARGRGGVEVVKVVDFGIAKAMTGDEGQQVTKTGLVVGTPEYMSPEQLSGDVLDGRSDVYSLALVCYRMLTGTFPFPSETAQEMMIKRLTDLPQPLDAARPGVAHPPALQQVMDHALARMPADRFASAVQFAGEVVAAAAGWHGSAGADSEGATQLMSATDPSAGATMRLTPTAVGPLAGYDAPTRGRPTSAPATPTTPRPVSSPPPARRRKTPVLAVAAVVALAGGGATAAILLPWGGGDSGVPNGPARLDSQVTGDTAGRGQARRDSSRTTPNPPDTNRGQPENGGGTPPPTVPDSAAVFAEISDLIDRSVDPSAGSTVRARAMELYEMTDLQPNLRADAAAVAAQVYADEANYERACALLRNASRLLPSRTESFRRTMNQWQCGS
jgi:serine/threonine-protein kinase